jgi:hypothetical protein
MLRSLCSTIFENNVSKFETFSYNFFQRFYLVRLSQPYILEISSAYVFYLLCDALEDDISNFSFISTIIQFIDNKIHAKKMLVKTTNLDMNW